MRRLLILIVTSILFSTANSFGQSVKLQMKNGEEKVVTINAFGSDQLFITGGNIKFKDIASVTFTKVEDASTKAQADLKKAGINVLVDGVERVDTRPVLEIQKEATASIESLENSLEQFRIQRNTGKGLMLASLIGTVGLGILQSSYNTQNAENAGKADYELKNVSPILYGVAGGIGVIGFAIDMGASKHLKKKR